MVWCFWILLLFSVANYFTFQCVWLSIQAVGAKCWAHIASGIVYSKDCNAMQCSLRVRRRGMEGERVKKTQSKIKKLLWPYANSKIVTRKNLERRKVFSSQETAYLSLKIETGETFAGTVFFLQLKNESNHTCNDKNKTSQAREKKW